jgi:hypothetical protein
MANNENPFYLKVQDKYIRFDNRNKLVDEVDNASKFVYNPTEKCIYHIKTKSDCHELFCVEYEFWIQWVHINEQNEIIWHGNNKCITMMTDTTDATPICAEFLNELSPLLK